MSLRLTAPGASSASTFTLPSVAADLAGLPHGIVSYAASGATLGAWSLRFNEAQNAGVSGVLINANGHTRLDPGSVRDVIFVVRYKV